MDALIAIIAVVGVLFLGSALTAIYQKYMRNDEVERRKRLEREAKRLKQEYAKLRDVEKGEVDQMSQEGTSSRHQRRFEITSPNSEGNLHFQQGSYQTHQGHFQKKGEADLQFWGIERG